MNPNPTPSPSKLAALAETPTPRTNDAIHRYWMGGIWSDTFADFARQLERELTQLRAENEELRGELVEARASLQDAREAKNRYKAAASGLAAENLSETEALHAQLTHLKAELERANGLLSWCLSCPDLYQPENRERLESHLNPKKTTP